MPIFVAATEQMKRPNLWEHAFQLAQSLVRRSYMAVTAVRCRRRRHGSAFQAACLCDDSMALFTSWCALVESITLTRNRIVLSSPDVVPQKSN